MRVAVYPHTLEIGGSQLNAIELAGAVRDFGCDVVVFGQDGALRTRIEQLGLEFIEAPTPRRRPSPAVLRALCDLVGQRRIDLVHGYEWTTALEAYWGPRARLGTPVVATVMSMAVAPFLPYEVPLVVGTEQIAAHERTIGRPRVQVIEPPVDVDENAPGVVPVQELQRFRDEHGLGPDDFVLTCVTRLAAELKLEGLLAALAVVERLAVADPALRLLIVGDGPARRTIEERAAAVNRRAGRAVVVLTGELPDPRPAYAVADVSLGMGGSALRAMAFGTALIVQGERGFWELLTPQTFEQFRWTGWYGVGTDPADGPARLSEALDRLRSDAGLRAALGGYARTLAEERFSLRAAAEKQARIYRSAVSSVSSSRPGRPGRPGRPEWRSAGASGLRFARYEVARRMVRLAGRAASDDFNARPVAAGKGT